MGLLNGIFGKIVDSVLQQVKDAAAQGNAATTNRPASTPARQTSTTTTSRVWQEPVEKSAAEWRAYFREILQAECAGYGIRENVPVTELAGYSTEEFKLYKTRPRQAYKAEWGQPYSFVLFEGIQPKAVVMLGDGHSHDSNVKYLVARMYAKKLGLPYINFYTQMGNERGYVISRLRRFLH